MQFHLTCIDLSLHDGISEKDSCYYYSNTAGYEYLSGLWWKLEMYIQELFCSFIKGTFMKHMISSDGLSQRLCIVLVQM